MSDLEVGQVVSLKIRFNNSGVIATKPKRIDEDKNVYMDKEEILGLNP